VAYRRDDQCLQGAGQLRRNRIHPPLLLRALGCVALAVLCASALAAPAEAAKRKRAKPKPAPAQAAPSAPAAPAPRPGPPTIPLQRNLRFVIRPTLLGLLPPPDPLNFGEAFVRVLDAAPAHLTLRYEIKEQLEQDKATNQLYLLGSAPQGTKTIQLTRIKRGDLGVSLGAAPPQLLPPMFWTDRNWDAPGGLLWLPSGVLEVLKAGQEPEWPVTFPSTGIPMADQIPGIIDLRRRSVGLDPAMPVKLQLLGPAGYRCRVNGAAVDLPAIRAIDTLLLAEYWFLDDPANPMLLKLSYLPLQEADPSSAGWAALINAGGGCAVTQIDF
jgi:hypothetical protein